MGRRSTVKTRNVIWKNITNKYKYEIRILYNNLSEDEALEIEKSLIAYYKFLGHCKANITVGGRGITGYRHTKKSKLKISKAGKGRSGFFKGKKLPKETRLKMSRSRLGKRRAPESYTGKTYTNNGQYIYINGTSRYKSSAEASKIVGCTIQTLRRWAKSKKFGWRRIKNV